MTQSPQTTIPVRRLPKSQYSAYINSEAWHAVRRRYKLQLPWICDACSGIDKLELHHMTYDRLGFELLSDLIPLCVRCHSLVHKYAKANKEDPNGLRTGVDHVRRQRLAPFIPKRKKDRTKKSVSTPKAKASKPKKPKIHGAWYQRPTKIKRRR